MICYLHVCLKSCVVFAIAQSQSNSLASFAEYSNYSQAQCPICIDMCNVLYVWMMFHNMQYHAMICNVPGVDCQMNMHVMLGEKVWGNNIINQSRDWFSLLHLWCHTLNSARSTCITKPVLKNLKTLCFWKRMAAWLPFFNYIADLPVCNFCTLHWLSNAWPVFFRFPPLSKEV